MMNVSLALLQLPSLRVTVRSVLMLMMSALMMLVTASLLVLMLLLLLRSSSTVVFFHPEQPHSPPAPPPPPARRHTLYGQSQSWRGAFCRASTSRMSTVASGPSLGPDIRTEKPSPSGSASAALGHCLVQARAAGPLLRTAAQPNHKCRHFQGKSFAGCTPPGSMLLH